MSKTAAFFRRVGLDELKGLRWQNFLLLICAGCINAVGVTMFLAPVNLYDSGMSGTAMLLWQATPPSSPSRRFPTSWAPASSKNEPATRHRKSAACCFDFDY